MTIITATIWLFFCEYYWCSTTTDEYYWWLMFRSWAVEESSLARWKRVLTTGCVCCIGCSDLKLRYLSEWAGLRYTAESKWPLGERLTRSSKNGRHPSFFFPLWIGWSFLYCSDVSKIRTTLISSWSQKCHLIAFPQTWRVCKGF